MPLCAKMGCFSVTLEELKLRQLAGQHLLTLEKRDTVIRDLCGVQAQFLGNAMHALALRCSDFDPQNTDGLVKSWTVRGTMHVFSESDLPLFLHEGRSHFLRPCDTLEGDDKVSAERKQYFADLIVDNVALGTDSREQLKEICAAHGMTEGESESLFNPWGGLLRALCENGTLCHKVQEKKAFLLCPSFEPMAEEEARLELARRYFTHFGPATVKDAAYFFGTTQANVKKQLNKLPVESVEWDGKTYFFIDKELPNREIPDCLFLAGFDQLLLGHEKTESLFLPLEHLRGIFNLAGIVMPAVLLRGRVVGKWKRTGRKLAVTLFEDISDHDKKRIEESAFGFWHDLHTMAFS